MIAVSIAWASRGRTAVVWLVALAAMWLAVELAAAVTRRRPPLDDMDLTLAKLRKGLRR